MFGDELKIRRNSKSPVLVDLRVTARKKSSIPKAKRPYYSFSKIKDMNWNQASKRFPGLNPMGDIDFDGSRNKNDCKPFDPARDGVFGRLLGKVTGDKYGQSKKDYQKERVVKKQERVVKKDIRATKKRIRVAESQVREQKWRPRIEKLNKYTKQLEKFRKGYEKKERVVAGGMKKVYTGAEKEYAKTGSSIRRTAGYQGTTKGKKGGKKYATAGRPKGTLKVRINPFTGQPIKIPATEFYKLKKKYKQAIESQAQATSQQVDTAQTRALARRGIPPEIAQEIVDKRQLQSIGYEPEEEQAETPLQSQEVEPTEMQEKMARLRAMKQIKQSQAQPQAIQQVPTQQYQRQQVQQVPTQYPQQYPQQYMQQQRPVRLKKDILTGRVIAEPLPQREQWTIPRRHRRVIV